MKIFWSWQADTPGNIGRHFVRNALSEAIDALKADNDITEPSEREARDALEFDQDRKGVSGSTIFPGYHGPDFETASRRATEIFTPREPNSGTCRPPP